MTLARAWPTESLLLNPGFESWSAGPVLDNWSTSGTTSQSTTSANGTYSLQVAPGGAVWQDIKFGDANGRWVDLYNRLALTMLARFATSTEDDEALAVKVFLLGTGGAFKYAWDNDAGEWEELPDGADATSGKSTYFYPTSAFARYALPMIRAPRDASEDIAESWSIRVLIANEADAAGADILLDDVTLQHWKGNARAATLGRYVVCWNGYDYPCKYDVLTGSVTELSLHPPYWGDNSALPGTTGATTGGNLLDSYFYGYAYTFLNKNIGEESAPMISIIPDSDFSPAFIESPNAGAGSGSSAKITIDFSSIELPNLESDKGTDNSEITHIRVYRTTGSETEEPEAQNKLLNTSLYHEGDVAVGGTFVSSVSDEDLVRAGLTTDVWFNPMTRPMPLFSVGAVWRNRIWVAGGRTFRLGSVNLTNGDYKVVGYGSGGAEAPTLWGRGAELYTVFKADGDTREYPVLGYIYEGDDGAGSSEKLFLGDPYAGTTRNKSDYVVKPKHGRVWVSMEGNPAKAESLEIFLEGADSAPVTAIVPAGDILLFLTADGVYGFDYDEAPGDKGGNVAQAIDRSLGCIAPGSAVEIHGTAYWLSKEGVVRYSPGGRPEVISGPIHGMFTDPEDTDFVVRSRADLRPLVAEATHYRAGRQYLLALRTASGKGIGANVVVAFNYMFGTWDVLRTDIQIARWSTVLDNEGREVLLAHDAHGGVWRWDKGYTDGAGEANNSGKLWGRVVTATEQTAQLSAKGALYVGRHVRGVFLGDVGPGRGLRARVARLYRPRRDPQGHPVYGHHGYRGRPLGRDPGRRRPLGHRSHRRCPGSPLERLPGADAAQATEVPGRGLRAP